MSGVLTEDFNELLRAIASDGKLGGVYMGIPTGEVLTEEDTTYIEILIHGKSFFAKPCMMFGHYSVPNKEWLDKYKKEIMCCVAFENGNPAHPVFMGIVPLDGKAPTGNYPNTSGWKSVEFNYLFDDKAKSATIQKINGDVVERTLTITDNLIKAFDKNGNFLVIDTNLDTIEIKSKNGQGVKFNINTILGGGEGVQSAVLGDILKSLLEQTLQTLSTATVIVNPTTFIGVFDPAVIAQLNSIKAQLINILSKKVKLD